MSVALVTRNRPDSLERTLRSLRAQNTQPYEVVVSDDSDQQQAAVVQELTRRFDCRYVRGPKRGLYANRNHAALACEGTHIRTMDDDHTFPVGHIAACRTAIETASEAVWIIGECLPGQEGSGQQWVCPPQLHPRGFSTTPAPQHVMWAIADGATIYPRAIFDHGHRFSEQFVFGASYLEWGSRLHWLGYDIRHLAATYVIHHFDLATRSYSDGITSTASRLFAGLCHAFIYQPTARNQLLAVAEAGAVTARQRRAGIAAVIRGLKAYRVQSRSVARLLGECPSEQDMAS